MAAAFLLAGLSLGKSVRDRLRVRGRVIVYGGFAVAMVEGTPSAADHQGRIQVYPNLLFRQVSPA